MVALTYYGGHSDTVCVPEIQAFAIPHGKHFTEAAAIPVNYLTAYHILFRAASIRPGERVLVHMAAGGLGTAALQLCRTVDGVQTFGTASAAKHEAIRRRAAPTPSTTTPRTTSRRSGGSPTARASTWSSIPSAARTRARDLSCSARAAAWSPTASPT